MSRSKDETGRRYGHLLVVSVASERDPSRGLRWNCICDCGNTSTPYGRRLRSGETTTCGCRNGRAHSDAYRSWQSMNQRCLNRNNTSFPRYGGRGIAVCKRWRQGEDRAFENFLEDMGERPTPDHSVDRIDSDGPYAPDNCRWATGREQANNRRNNRVFVHKGQARSITDWAREQGITKAAVFGRIYRGVPVAEALELQEAP